MLTVLGGLAEFERELIRARTDDGRKRAKARGVRLPVEVRSPHRRISILAAGGPTHVAGGQPVWWMNFGTALLGLVQNFPQKWVFAERSTSRARS
jgi:hypothetical protein